MLAELAIKNFAIIDDVRVSFTEGLNILSGETGAGKSIIINSVKLLLGERASSKDIRDGADVAEIEALFDVSCNELVLKKLEEFAYLNGRELLVRRVISKSKNQVYINGKLANLNILSEITKNLTEISSQHAFQSLLKEENHILLLDSFAGLEKDREVFKENFESLLRLINERKKLKVLFKEQKERVELLSFQKKEIESLQIEDIEEDIKKETEKKQLKYASELYEILYGITQNLYEKDGAILEQIIETKKELSKAIKIDETLLQYEKVFDDIHFNIEDVVVSLNKYIENINSEDVKLEEVEERLNLLQRAKRKYGKSLKDVLEYYDKISITIEETENLDKKIIENKKEIEEKHTKICNISDELSNRRKKAAIEFSKKIERELFLLEMEDAKFKIAFDKIEKNETTSKYLVNKGCVINDKGIDTAVFMIAPNFGERLKNLKKTASGGELSRVVLAIRSILAEKDFVSTIVFDEADAGIGGKTAEKIGEKMLSLSKTHQVICITHLHQIAKFAKSHFKITKKIKNERTVTQIDFLDEEEQIVEIARMLSGKEITETTKRNAKEMLGSHNK